MEGIICAQIKISRYTDKFCGHFVMFSCLLANKNKIPRYEYTNEQPRTKKNFAPVICGLWAKKITAWLILQLGLHKRILWYNFSSCVGSMRLIPKNFRSAALSTATQPWWSAALPTRHHNSRRSWVLVLLKRLITPNTSITVIKFFRSTNSHHGEAPEYPTS